MSVRGKRVAVSGGAGFIGSHLVDRLLVDDPDELVVIDNFFLGNSDNLQDASRVRPELQVLRVDASDLASMQEVVSANSIEVLFDLAVVPLPTSLKFPAWTVYTNVAVATVACELARRDAFADLVHVSSSEAYGTARYVPMDEQHPLDAITPYAASKVGADAVVVSYAQTFGIKSRILRPFNTFGPRQNANSYAGIVPIVIERVLQGREVEIFGDGLQTRDFTFVARTADYIARAYSSTECVGRVVNIGSGVEISIKDLVDRILVVMGRTQHPVRHLEPRLGDVRRHCADIRQAATLFGATTQGPTDEELAQTVDWYRETMRCN